MKKTLNMKIRGKIEDKTFPWETKIITVRDFISKNFDLKKQTFFYWSTPM